MVARSVLLAALALLTASCGGRSASVPTVTVTTPDSAATESAGRAGICPVTLPNGKTPNRENGAGMNHGNGRLWTTLWPYDLVIADADYVEPDGSVRMKWPWWRGVEGQVRVSGRLLDGEAPPLTADVSSGYGRSGFQPSTIIFPTEGCWEVTAHVGSASLTFVTFVVKASTYALEQSG